MGKDIYLDHANKKFEIEGAQIKGKQNIEKRKLEITEKTAILMGRAQAFEYTSRFASIAELASLKEIKDNQLYKEIGDGTWEGFCDRLSINRKSIDERLTNINQFGLEFMESTQKLGLTRQDLRRLRALPEDARTDAVSQAVSLDNPTKEQIRDIMDKIEDQATDIALLKDKLKKSEEKLAKKDSAILRGQEQCCDLEDKLRYMRTQLDRSVIRADEKASVDLLSEVKRIFDAGCIIKITQVDMDAASPGIKAAVVSILEYMNRMLKQTFIEIFQTHPEIDAHDVLDVPGFKNPWDNVIYSPEKDQEIAAGIEQRMPNAKTV